jgi:hypothetical protein
VIEGHDLELLHRSVEHATVHHSGAALDEALGELGWSEALAEDPRAAVTELFTLQGAANATSSALDEVLATGLGRPGAAVVLPAVGRWAAPGRRGPGGLAVDGLGTAGLGTREHVLIVVGDDSAFAVDAGSVPQRPIGGADPALGLIEVRGAITGATEIGAVDWDGALALGQLALGHELVGASRRMLELAREHALGRVQFGQPIAAFQAVRHRLAETLVAIEAADALLAAAWLTGTPETAAMAKATAGRSARVAARHCQQVLAGIGFTTEHPFHRYVRRVLVLEQLLGSTGALTRRHGEEILERGELPPLLPL